LEFIEFAKNECSIREIEENDKFADLVNKSIEHLKKLLSSPQFPNKYKEIISNEEVIQRICSFIQSERLCLKYHQNSDISKINQKQGHLINLGKQKENIQKMKEEGKFQKMVEERNQLQIQLENERENRQKIEE
jgi:hypothetical protein